MAVEGRRPFGIIREAYRVWWYETEAANEKFRRVMQAEEDAGGSAEDLGDFVETLATLRTFGPNPRQFPNGS